MLQFDAQLLMLGIDLPAALPRSDHSASAWVAGFPDGTPVLVITADSTEEFEALVRPLPHYGGQNYVLFAAEHAIKCGVWKIERGPLYRDLGHN